MTKNSLYCVGVIRGVWGCEIYVKAKSVDKLKTEICRKIDLISERQNKEYKKCLKK